jgi:hypothetical protein
LSSRSTVTEFEELKTTLGDSCPNLRGTRVIMALVFWLTRETSVPSHSNNMTCIV